jgi:hypothetical protein
MASHDFTPHARARIKRAVRKIEGQVSSLDPGTGVPQAAPSPDERLFELTAALAKWGEASAHPMRWYAGLNSEVSGRKGKYKADSATTIKVRDATGLCQAASGERVWAVALGSAAGTVWVVIRAAGGLSIRSYVLRTDLAQGKSCIIEETAFVAGVLGRTGKTYRAFHRSGEFIGTADLGCGDFIIRPDTPTAEELDDHDITLPEGSISANQSEIVELLTITCTDFLLCPCAAGG